MAVVVVLALALRRSEQDADFTVRVVSESPTNPPLVAEHALVMLLFSNASPKSVAFSLPRFQVAGADGSWTNVDTLEDYARRPPRRTHGGFVLSPQDGFAQMYGLPTGHYRWRATVNVRTARAQWIQTVADCLPRRFAERLYYTHITLEIPEHAR